MRRIRRHLTYANVMATIAVFVVLGGGAYAAFKLPKNSVRSKNIVNGQVKGDDVAERSLAKVPNAARVNGLRVVKINGRQSAGATAKTILNLAGLRLSMSCTAGLGATATTTKQNSSLYGFADYPPTLDYDSFDYEGGAFDTTTTVDLDDEFGGLGDPRIGSLAYEAPDGSVVSVDFAADFNGTSDCVFTGTAIGG